MTRRGVLLGVGGAAAAGLAWKLFRPMSGISVNLWTGVSRRMGGVGTVSSGAVNRQIPQDEFVAGCAKYQKEAMEQTAMAHVVNGLWKSEGFATTFGKYRLPDNTLDDPRIPRESLGIVHVGYGAASTEHTRFDPAKLTEISETKCHKDYKLQMIEGIGSILRIYEPGMFKKMCGMMGLIPKDAPDGPDKAGFFPSFMSAFPTEQQRLITHGYGRLIAFSRMSVYDALDEARALPAERVAPAVQGIAFASAMMNAPDMAGLLEGSAELDAATRAPFQTGLVYGLAYCEWFRPGFLAAWKPQGKLEGALVAHAVKEAEGSMSRGHILPFRLENPVSV